MAGTELQLVEVVRAPFATLPCTMMDYLYRRPLSHGGASALRIHNNLIITPLHHLCKPQIQRRAEHNQKQHDI